MVIGLMDGWTDGWCLDGRVVVGLMAGFMDGLMVVG
jgi:hypothetical protein